MFNDSNYEQTSEMGKTVENVVRLTEDSEFRRVEILRIMLESAKGASYARKMHSRRLTLPLE
jgi:hypothetical protein